MQPSHDANNRFYKSIIDKEELLSFLAFRLTDKTLNRHDFSLLLHGTSFSLVLPAKILTILPHA
jgi:hypothetical protein